MNGLQLTRTDEKKMQDPFVLFFLTMQCITMHGICAWVHCSALGSAVQTVEVPFTMNGTAFTAGVLPSVVVSPVSAAAGHNYRRNLQAETILLCAFVSSL